MTLVGLPLSCLCCALSKLKDHKSILLSIGFQEEVLYLQAGRAPHCFLWVGSARDWRILVQRWALWGADSILVYRQALWETDGISVHRWALRGADCIIFQVNVVWLCEWDVQTSTKRVRSSDPLFCSPMREEP